MTNILKSSRPIPPIPKGKWYHERTNNQTTKTSSKKEKLTLLVTTSPLKVIQVSRLALPTQPYSISIPMAHIPS
jgi:hypothetical protein